MDWKEYSKRALAVSIYPNAGSNLAYPALGLTGEAGEVAEKVKKIIRDQNGQLSEYNKQEIAKELGDVLWYLNALAFELGHDLEWVAEKNIEKLEDRKARGVLHGDGDNR